MEVYLWWQLWLRHSGRSGDGPDDGGYLALAFYLIK